MDLVLWRDKAGEVHLLEDRCPHRGIPLSIARHDGDRLTCIYHGAELAGDGTLLALPGCPDSDLVGKKAVRSFPVKIHRNTIFAWYGDELHREPAPFVLPERLTSPDYEAFLAYAEWKAPHRLLTDNNMDPMHGTFLHAASHSMFQGKREADFELEDTNTGFVFKKKDQAGINFDWSEWYDVNFQSVMLEIPYPASGGPGGPFGIVFHVTPIEENVSACFFWRHRKVSGWQREVWKFLYRNRLEARHWHVLEQDRLVSERTSPHADENEYLYSHDIGLSKVRRLNAQEAERQVKALKQAAAAE
jgi:phenylpropionate dioxygenase-like ring-hydroxylating dioxygenase large terminal subunit